MEKQPVFLGTTVNPEAENLDETRLVAMCKGDVDAMNFLRSYTAFCHMVDDLVDRDVEWDAERVSGVCVPFLKNVCFNPFFVKHSGVLLVLIVSGFSAWCDSDKAAKHPDDRVKASADVLKSFYFEVACQIAEIVGGWEHRRYVSSMWRSFDFDFKKEPPCA